MLTLLEEKQLRIESGVTAVEIAFRKLGLVKDEISSREAYRLFGEAKVKSWTNQGFISRVKNGTNTSKTTYSLIELETLQSLEAKRKLK